MVTSAINCPTLSWDDIQVFLTIARARTLTGAAPKLNLSQPTLGRRLKTLERLVGSPLFVRTSDGLQLTIDGCAILTDAEMMEQSALALERRLANESRELAGLLRIASGQWIMRHVLGLPLAAFARLHPEIKLALIRDQRSIDLTYADADVAFRYAFSGEQAFTEPDVVQRRLTSVQYDLFASSGYLAEYGGWPADGCGDGHRLIIEDAAASDESFDKRWFQHHFPKAQVSINCGYSDMQALACQQGAGVALLPCPVGANYDLEQFGIGETLPIGTVWLGYHRDLRALRRLREVINYVVGAVQKEC